MVWRLERVRKDYVIFMLLFTAGKNMLSTNAPNREDTVGNYTIKSDCAYPTFMQHGISVTNGSWKYRA